MCFAHLWWFNLLLRVRIDQEVHVFILLDDTCNTVNYNQRWAVYSIQNTKVLHEYTFGSHRLFRLLENVMAFFGNLLYKCMKIEFTKMEGGRGSDPTLPPPPLRSAHAILWKCRERPEYMGKMNHIFNQGLWARKNCHIWRMNF